MDYGMIFDVDGVLVDSYQLHYESWCEFCGPNGLSMTESEFAASFGRTSREVIAEHWGSHHFNEQQVRQIDETKEAIFRRRLLSHFTPMPGAVELLDDLHAAGFQLGVGSSAPPDNVEQVLGCLGRKSLFHAIVTGVDVTHGKPNPEVFSRGVVGLGIPANRCIVIDDAPAGVSAANAAGTHSIGFASTGRRPEQLSHAACVIQDLRELTVPKLKEFIDGG